jgi:hypothetical protein
VIRLDLLELLLLVWLLHIDGIVVETGNVLRCIDDLTRLQVVNLSRSLSVLTEFFQVVNCHQYSGQLCNLAQLFA